MSAPFGTYDPATAMRGVLSPVQHTAIATQALCDVIAERRRQVDQEGWSPEHDDQHVRGEIAAAAGVYALVASGRFMNIAKRFWPWDFNWWKPCDERRNLVKAGALILAEIERIDRLVIAAGSKEVA